MGYGSKADIFIREVGIEEDKDNLPVEAHNNILMVFYWLFGDFGLFNSTFISNYKDWHVYYDIM